MQILAWGVFGLFAVLENWFNYYNYNNHLVRITLLYTSMKDAIYIGLTPYFVSINYTSIVI